MKQTGTSVGLALLALLAWLGPAVRAADDETQKAVNRAHDFLKTTQRGKDILSYVHFGAKYVDHNYKETLGVTDPAGKSRPGHFALVYTFEWEDDGETEVAFLCDAKGAFYEVQSRKSNGVLNRPFVLANAAVKLLGNLLIEAFKDKMTAAERRDVQKIVNDADAKAMLEWSLKFQQALGR